MNSDATAGHNNRGDVVIRTVAALLTLSGLFVAARLYTRLVLLKRAGVDDLLVVLAWISAGLSGGFAVAQVKHGLGRRQDTVPIPDLIMVFKYLFFSILTYNIALTLVKVAVLAAYLRLIVKKNMKIIIYCMMGIVILYGVETIITGTITCLPVRRFWDLSVPGTCLNRAQLWIANAAINMTTDFIIFFLPLPVIFNLRMSLRQKLMLACVFGIGFCVCIISLIRLKTLTAAANAVDYTWDGPSASAWSAGELSTAIICSCCIALKPFLSSLAPKIFSTGRSQRTDDDDHGKRENERPSAKNTRDTSTYGQSTIEKSVDISTSRTSEPFSPTLASPYWSHNPERV